MITLHRDSVYVGINHTTPHRRHEDSVNRRHASLSFRVGPRTDHSDSQIRLLQNLLRVLPMDPKEPGVETTRPDLTGQTRILGEHGLAGVYLSELASQILQSKPGILQDDIPLAPLASRLHLSEETCNPMLGCAGAGGVSVLRLGRNQKAFPLGATEDPAFKADLGLLFVRRGGDELRIVLEGLTVPQIHLVSLWVLISLAVFNQSTWNDAYSGLKLLRYTLAPGSTSIACI